MLAAALGPTLVEAGILLGEAGQHQPRPGLPQASRTLLAVNRCFQSSLSFLCLCQPVAVLLPMFPPACSRPGTCDPASLLPTLYLCSRQPVAVLLPVLQPACCRPVTCVTASLLPSCYLCYSQPVAVLVPVLQYSQPVAVLVPVF